MVVRAPAKVNLSLLVGPRRGDGFHDLHTVYCAVGLWDEVTLEPSTRLEVAVTGEGAEGVPADGSNLAAHAVALLARETGCDPGVRVTIVKAIPVAGGCAGGSADAAAALVGCDELWGTGLGRERLAEIAAELGSDVPFSVLGGVALGTGRGERLTAVLGSGTTTYVLALADGGLSTPAVYAELDRLRAQGPPRLAGDPAPVLAAVRSGDPVALGRSLTNDLEEAAVSLRPALQLLLDGARERGALGAVVSGSGPTVLAVAADRDAGERLGASLVDARLCRAARVVTGPVPGARVVA